MSKQFIWHFKINTAGPVWLPEGAASDSLDPRWELRFFWPETATITLNGLDEHFLELSHYKIKYREDRYYLLPTEPYNLKSRHHELFYKPILTKQHGAIAFGKKINLQQHNPNGPLPGAPHETAQTLIQRIQTEGQAIAVTKEALVHTFTTIPTVKLELARLRLNNIFYFSICLESQHLDHITLMAEHMLLPHSPTDYVSFLRKKTKETQP